MSQAPAAHWQAFPIKRLAEPGAFTDGDWIESPFITDSGVRLLQTGNIGIGKFKEQGFRYISEDSFAALRCTEVFPGDVLICRLADPVGRACLAPDLGVKMITSVDVAILRPTRQHDPRFIVYALSSAPYLGYLESICRGGTRDRVSRSMLGDVTISVPPYHQQRAIADYLDRRTGEIDSLIERKEQLMQLLSEKRISAASTFTLSGLHREVPMKDSGIPAVGKVPAHWRVERAKTVFREFTRRAGDASLELLSVSHITGVTPRRDKPDITMFLAESAEGNKVCGRDDLVVNTMWAWMGAVGIAPCDGMVSPSYNVYRIRSPQEVQPLYFDLMLRTPAAVAEMNRLSKGITASRLRLYPESFLNMRIPLPPKQEQAEILDAVDRLTGKDAHEAAKLSESIELLREYRQSIVTAAATGQLEIPAQEAA